jgi:putative ABC transport system permease protein
VNRSLSNERLMASLSGIFSALATLLAMIGLYGVMAYTVSRQSQEIAVRLALGARRQQVWVGVLRWAGALVVMGVVIGLGATLATTRLIADQLWNTTAFDVPTFGATVLVIAVVALLACLVPARRAMKVDPMVALRRE